MIYIKAFLFAGFICALAELLLSTTKLKPGHITSLFVVSFILAIFFKEEFGFLGLTVVTFVHIPLT